MSEGNRTDPVPPAASRGWLSFDRGPWALVIEGEPARVARVIDALRSAVRDGVVSFATTTGTASPACEATTAAVRSSVESICETATGLVAALAEVGPLPVDAAGDLLGFVEVALRHLGAVAELVAQIGPPVAQRDIRVDLRDN
jgi:hypothetical protein